jgi:LPS O-antigen subunit length determinant protein (WzzB/FepE family)
VVAEKAKHESKDKKINTVTVIATTMITAMVIITTVIAATIMAKDLLGLTPPEWIRHAWYRLSRIFSVKMTATRLPTANVLATIEF